MKRALLVSLALLICAAAQQASLINTVRGLIDNKDLAGAERAARAYQARTPASPELAAALSWLARAALAAKNLDHADALASETTKMASRFLVGQKLDDDPWLPTAAGAAIEVHAQVLAARGERAEAVEYLREQQKQFTGTSLPERIRKNINLLSMEGKPAPALEMEFPALSTLRGKPVLLFFWAHWCGDCKAEVPILARLQRTFEKQGLVIIGPTKLFGYVAGGEEAPPDKERKYLEEILLKYYSALPKMKVPVNARNFITYGASSTPTLVLIDRAGIVRYYHPGSASEAELTAKVRAVL